MNTVQKMNFSLMDFFSKWDQVYRKTADLQNP